jgi:predicted glycogen debranching enzyme
MGFIKLEKDKLVNLEYSLERELFRANDKGSYTSTTLVGCNTRKYHGLLVWPEDKDNMHVLLSSINETIEQHDDEFRLGVSKYPGGVYDPHGHRYLREMYLDPIPTKIYRVGGVVLKKQRILCKNEHRVLTRYEILEAHSPTKLKIKPFVAFRNIHALSQANMDAETGVQQSENGIRYRMYEKYPYLYLQTNLKNKFIHAPDWNYNNEYEREQERGYPYVEDLFTPGYFVLDVKKGSEIIFSAGIKKASTRSLKQIFKKEVSMRNAPQNFAEALLESAEQFIIQPENDKKRILKTGYHWYNYKHGEALISLPGLCLTQNKFDLFEELLDTTITRFKAEKDIKQADIPLLFFYTIQHYSEYSKQDDKIWTKYGPFLTELIKKFKKGYANTILHDNGLLFIPDTNHPTSRMNETIDGEPVVKRIGFLNDINALWYNALMFYSEMAELHKDKKAQKLVGNLPERIQYFYSEIFYDEQSNSLYDFVYDTEQNSDVRPNQIFAASLCYSPISDEIKRGILETLRDELLTEKGLRTLSPKNTAYIGIYDGNEIKRKKAKHQGSVHPWLTGAFCEAWIKLHGKSGLNFVKEIYNGFEDEIYRAGLGTLSEIHDGNPPYEPKDAISYAPSVAELLRVKCMIDDAENYNKAK